jgi:NADPH2:quinone reductase
VKAVRFDEYGPIENLRVEEVEMPAVGHGEILVQVRAAGINPGEASIRKGYLDSIFPTTFPSGEGSDLAGVVTEVGPGAVGAFEVGDEVLGWSERRSSHAQYVSVPPNQLIAKPAALSWEVAGSLYVVGVTAYAAVRAVEPAQDDQIVVSAAAGGVGSLVVQLLKLRGADVIGIASEANHEWLRGIGVTPVSYGDGLADRIRAAAPAGVDAFIDTFGPEYVRLAVELGVAKDRVETIIAFDLVSELGIKGEGSSDASTPEILAEMAHLVESGLLRVEIAATYPLAQVREAYTELEKRHTRGKIVLVP